nr:hardening-induced 19.5 kda protein {N-terminal} [Chlorella vulgaris, Beijerink, IAM C-27, Peptide Partial, 15 aa] [Chlorella vulgaris]
LSVQPHEALEASEPQ